MIHESKKSYNKSLSDKLKSGSLSSKQWWTVLKTFISQNNSSCEPPLENDGVVYSNETDKANLLNNFFRVQTLLNDKDAVLLDIVPYTIQSQLQSLIFSPDEVKEILIALPIGKATGPDEISNRVLNELSSELSSPLCSFFNYSFIILLVKFLIFSKRLMCVLSQKAETYQLQTSFLVKQLCYNNCMFWAMIEAEGEVGYP